jgi:hypothetical protein
MSKKLHKKLIKLQNKLGKVEGKNTWRAMIKNGDI